VQIGREPISALPDTSQIDFERLRVDIGKFFVSAVKH
jgi:hypothetical protein